MDYKSYILEALKEINNKNSKKLQNKTVLINRFLEMGIERWTDRIFHPLDSEEIELLEVESKKPFPEKYKEFLSHCNGCFLFNGNFYIYGKAFLEKGMSREEMINQPFDLIKETEDPPCKISNDLFYFGGTPDSIFVFSEDKSILELERRSGKLLSTTENFDNWFVEKIHNTEMFPYFD